MNEEVKAIYEFAKKQQEINDLVAQKVPNVGYEQASTAYWTVCTFIEENFK